MKRKINFTIKKGVYCGWCADLMKRTLKQHFKIKKIKINLLKNNVHLITNNKIQPTEIISYLKKRGYNLTIQKYNL